MVGVSDAGNISEQFSGIRLLMLDSYLGGGGGCFCYLVSGLGPIPLTSKSGKSNLVSALLISDSNTV